MEQEPKTLRGRTGDLGQRVLRFIGWLVPQGQWDYQWSPREEYDIPWWRRPTEGQILWTMRLAILTVILAGLLTLISQVFNINFLGLLQILIIPLVIAGVGVWFNRQQHNRELEIAERRAQDDALNSYLDSMTELMIDRHLRSSRENQCTEDVQDVRAVAQAHTVTVLRRLDGDRKASIVRFLYEAGLIIKDRSVLDLGGADLRKANLRKANLRDVDLSGADLREAYLNRADLSRAKLKSVDLARAYLINTDLREADLREARLYDAAFGANSLSRTFKQRIGRFYLGVPKEIYTSQESLRQLVDDALEFEKRDNAVPTHLESSLQTRKEAVAEAVKAAEVSIFGSRHGFVKADLRGAILEGARGSEGILEQDTRLEGATMPNGQKYEDWLKSKDRTEDGEDEMSPGP